MPLTLRLSARMIEALDDRRRLEKDLPTRPEMVRRLLQVALELQQDDQG